MGFFNRNESKKLVVPQPVDAKSVTLASVKQTQTSVTVISISLSSDAAINMGCDLTQAVKARSQLRPSG